MILRFKDGTTKACSNPTEHRVLREGLPAGWVCTVRILDSMTSSEIEEVLTVDNISELTFCNRLLQELFVLSGYTKINNVIVRHFGATSEVEVQFGK